MCIRDRSISLRQFARAEPLAGQLERHVAFLRGELDRPVPGFGSVAGDFAGARHLRWSRADRLPCDLRSFLLEVAVAALVTLVSGSRRFLPLLGGADLD